MKNGFPKDLWREFEKQRPVIFSGLLDAVVCALRELQNVILDSLPRLADAALWATAGESAFGWERGTVLMGSLVSAHNRRTDRQVRVVDLALDIRAVFCSGGDFHGPGAPRVRSIWSRETFNDWLVTSGRRFSHFDCSTVFFDVCFHR